MVTRRKLKFDLRGFVKPNARQYKRGVMPMSSDMSKHLSITQKGSCPFVVTAGDHDYERLDQEGRGLITRHDVDTIKLFAEAIISAAPIGAEVAGRDDSPRKGIADEDVRLFATGPSHVERAISG